MTEEDQPDTADKVADAPADAPESKTLTQRMTRQYYAAMQGALFSSVGHWVLVRFFNNMLKPIYRLTDRVLNLFGLNREDEKETNSEAHEKSQHYKEQNGYSEKAKFIADGFLIQNALGMVGNVLGQVLFNRIQGEEVDTGKHIFGWVAGGAAQLLMLGGVEQFAPEQRQKFTAFLGKQLLPSIGEENPDGTKRNMEERQAAAESLANALMVNASSTAILPMVNEVAQYGYEQLRASHAKRVMPAAA